MTSKNMCRIIEKRARTHNRESGFTVLEMLVVASISIILAGAAVMKLDTAVKSVKMRSSVGEIAGVCQMARVQAVKDNYFYQVVLPTSGTTQSAFVDVYSNPEYPNPVTAGTFDARDPMVQLESQVSVYTGSVSPPSPPALTSMNLDSTFTPQAQTGGSATNPWFNNRGLPCVPNSTTSPTLCTTSVGTVGYVVYLQDAYGNWGAVTITPAGRIKAWTWNGLAWN